MGRKKTRACGQKIKRCERKASTLVKIWLR
jgi:hypothetical protein